jgi:hypothetical protein
MASINTSIALVALQAMTVVQDPSLLLAKEALTAKKPLRQKCNVAWTNCFKNV